MCDTVYSSGVLQRDCLSNTLSELQLLHTQSYHDEEEELIDLEQDDDDDDEIYSPPPLPPFTRPTLFHTHLPSTKQTRTLLAKLKTSTLQDLLQFDLVKTKKENSSVSMLGVKADVSVQPHQLLLGNTRRSIQMVLYPLLWGDNNPTTVLPQHLSTNSNNPMNAGNSTSISEGVHPLIARSLQAHELFELMKVADVLLYGDAASAATQIRDSNTDNAAPPSSSHIHWYYMQNTTYHRKVDFDHRHVIPSFDGTHDMNQRSTAAVSINIENLHQEEKEATGGKKGSKKKKATHMKACEIICERFRVDEEEQTRKLTAHKSEASLTGVNAPAPPGSSSITLQLPKNQYNDSNVPVSPASPTHFNSNSSNQALLNTQKQHNLTKLLSFLPESSPTIQKVAELKGKSFDEKNADDDDVAGHPDEKPIRSAADMFHERMQMLGRSDPTASRLDKVYFNKDDLRTFLRGAYGYGILLKFIPPRSQFNEVIRVTMNSVMEELLVQTRTNKISLYDTSYSYYERTVTYEQPHDYRAALHRDQPDREKPYKVKNYSADTSLYARIKLIISKLVVYLEAIQSEAKLKIHKLQLYFKRDIYNDIWLLWGDVLEFKPEPELNAMKSKFLKKRSDGERKRMLSIVKMNPLTPTTPGSPDSNPGWDLIITPQQHHTQEQKDTEQPESNSNATSSSATSSPPPASCIHCHMPVTPSDSVFIKMETLIHTYDLEKNSRGFFHQSRHSNVPSSNFTSPPLSVPEQKAQSKHATPVRGHSRNNSQFNMSHSPTSPKSNTSTPSRQSPVKDVIQASRGHSRSNSQSSRASPAVSSISDPALNNGSVIIKGDIPPFILYVNPNLTYLEYLDLKSKNSPASIHFLQSDVNLCLKCVPHVYMDPQLISNNFGQSTNPLPVNDEKENFIWMNKEQKRNHKLQQSMKKNFIQLNASSAAHVARRHSPAHPTASPHDAPSPVPAWDDSADVPIQPPPRLVNYDQKSRKKDKERERDEKDKQRQLLDYNSKWVNNTRIDYDELDERYTQSVLKTLSLSGTARSSCKSTSRKSSRKSSRSQTSPSPARSRSRSRSRPQSKASSRKKTSKLVELKDDTFLTGIAMDVDKDLSIDEHDLGDDIELHDFDSSMSTPIPTIASTLSGAPTSSPPVKSKKVNVATHSLNNTQTIKAGPQSMSRAKLLHKLQQSNKKSKINQSKLGESHPFMPHSNSHSTLSSASSTANLASKPSSKPKSLKSSQSAAALSSHLSVHSTPISNKPKLQPLPTPPPPLINPASLGRSLSRSTLKSNNTSSHTHSNTNSFNSINFATSAYKSPSSNRKINEMIPEPVSRSTTRSASSKRGDNSLRSSASTPALNSISSPNTPSTNSVVKSSSTRHSSPSPSRPSISPGRSLSPAHSRRISQLAQTYRTTKSAGIYISNDTIASKLKPRYLDPVPVQTPPPPPPPQSASKTPIIKKKLYERLVKNAHDKYVSPNHPVKSATARSLSTKDTQRDKSRTQTARSATSKSASEQAKEKAAPVEKPKKKSARKKKMQQPSVAQTTSSIKRAEKAAAAAAAHSKNDDTVEKKNKKATGKKKPKPACGLPATDSQTAPHDDASAGTIPSSTSSVVFTSSSTALLTSLPLSMPPPTSSSPPPVCNIRVFQMIVRLQVKFRKFRLAAKERMKNKLMLEKQRMEEAMQEKLKRQKSQRSSSNSSSPPTAAISSASVVANKVNSSPTNLISTSPAITTSNSSSSTNSVTQAASVAQPSSAALTTRSAHVLDDELKIDDLHDLDNLNIDDLRETTHGQL